MKGIVMETKEHKIIVMAKNGEFIEMIKPNHQLMVGEEIIVYNTKQKSHIIQRFVAVAAMFMFLLTSGYGVYGYYMPYGHVNVDINPSVEITYNLYKRVIDIKGLNDDGDQVVSNIQDYKNKSLDTVVNKVVDEAVEEKYIKNDGEDFVLVTVTELGKKIDDDQLYEAVDHHMKETKTSAEVMFIDNDKATYESAKEDKTSPGKKALIKKVISSDGDMNEVTLLDKKVKEIAHMVKGNGKENQSSNINYKKDKVKGNKGKQGNKKQPQNNVNGKQDNHEKHNESNLGLQGEKTEQTKPSNKGQENKSNGKSKENKGNEKNKEHDQLDEKNSNKINDTKKNDQGNRDNIKGNNQDGSNKKQIADDEQRNNKGDNEKNKDADGKDDKADKEKEKGYEKQEHKN